MENSYKLYSKKAIYIATFFGGPLAAGILFRKNCINLGREQQGLLSLIVGILFTAVIIGISMAMPDSLFDKFPGSLLPAIYTPIIGLILEKMMGKDINLHKENNGQFYSGWKAVGVGAFSMILLLGSIFGFIYFSEKEADFDSVTYQSKIDQFVKNESQSLMVFNNFENANKEYLIKELSKGLIVWNENLKITQNLSKMENLPAENIEIMSKLEKYSKLRIQHFELILKAVTEDTDKYSDEIQKTGVDIENILNLLSKTN